MITKSLLRHIANTHAPRPVKEALEKLDDLQNRVNDLKAEGRHLAHELAFGKTDACPVCNGRGFTRPETNSVKTLERAQAAVEYVNGNGHH